MLKREIGDVRLASLNAVVLRDLIDRRVDDGAGGVTIAADLSFLSAVLKWGRHDRRLDIPARLALEARESLKYRGLQTRSNERTREPTDDELERLRAHWKASSRRRIDMRTLCDFALATGMRLGEICRLEIDDVDCRAKTVIVRDRKDPQRKAGNNQTVPLLPKAWEIVERLIEVRHVGRLFAASAASASTAFTRACNSLGIEDLHFHDLRHRATSEFFRMGLDIPQVALLTGHKTWTMLRRYTEIKAADVHAALAQEPIQPKDAMTDQRDFNAKSPIRDVVAALLALALPAPVHELIPRLTDMVSACKGVVDHRGKIWGELSESECNIVATRVGVIAHEIIRTGRSEETGETLHSRA
jgi:integrase